METAIRLRVPPMGPLAPKFDQDGRPVVYHPLVADIGREPYLLALHRDEKNWNVSDPRTGKLICAVWGYSRGYKTESGHLNLPKARVYARRTLKELQLAIGTANFRELFM